MIGFSWKRLFIVIIFILLKGNVYFLIFCSLRFMKLNMLWLIMDILLMNIIFKFMYCVWKVFSCCMFSGLYVNFLLIGI